MTTLVFDTETTGVTADDEVIKLAVCDIDGRPVFQSYFGAERHSEWPTAMAVNHISPDMVAGLPTLSQRAAEVSAVLDTADTLAAYNARFDIRFLEAAGIHIDRAKVRDAMIEFSQAAQLEWNNQHQDWRWFKLTEAAAMCHLTQFGAHDPMEDVKATAHILRYLDDPTNTQNDRLTVDTRYQPAPRNQ